MPAFALTQVPVTIGLYDIVGQDSDTLPKFVRHVALNNARNLQVVHSQQIDVVHMGPPLVANKQCFAHAGGLVPLTISDMKTIASWIETVKDEYVHHRAGRREQYVIHPPWIDQRDPNTDVRRYRRYSCVGFVLDSYIQVNIRLLEWEDEASLPPVSRHLLEVAYPEIVGRDLAPLGIQGAGPWRVVLAGYLLHSLNRDAASIRNTPYIPQSGDECYG